MWAIQGHTWTYMKGLGKQSALLGLWRQVNKLLNCFLDQTNLIKQSMSDQIKPNFTAVTGYEERRQLLVDFCTVSLKVNLN